MNGDTKHIALFLGLLLTTAFSPGAVKVDSVGTTNLDVQNYGPTWQRVYNLPGHGIYVTWVKTGMFYNHLDYASGSWLGQTPVFADTNVSGNLDVNMTAGSPFYRSAFVSTRTRRPVLPVVGVESIPGSGSFVSRPGGPALEDREQPAIALCASGHVHLVCADDRGDTVLYTRSTDNGLNWTAPVSVCGADLPRDPTHNITASKSSDKVAVIWSRDGVSSLWCNRSSDGGSTWSGPRDLFPLPSSISGAQPGKLGGYGVFDDQDRLNVVTQVWDGSSPRPAEIWHYLEGRDDAWVRVFRYAPAQVLGDVEDGDAFVCRPSIAVGPGGDLFVAWMNYDSVNYEPTTQIARADVMIAQSATEGASWSRPFRATGPDLASRVSPCLASTAGDSLVVVCIEDQTAGLHERGHGPQTVNQVTVLRVPTRELPGVAGPTPDNTHPRQGLSVAPNPTAGGHVVVSTDLAPGTLLTLWDSQGRIVQTSVTASRRMTFGTSGLAPGVYHLCANTDGGPVKARLTVVR